MRLFGILLLVAVALEAQQTVAPKPAEAPKTEACTVEGEVVNASTGEPLKKATVLLVQTGKAQGARYSTASMAGGRFAFDDLEPGKYHLSVTRKGYAQMQYGARAPGRPGATLSLDPGQHLRDVVFRLIPQAVVTGRVVDADGDALAYAFVRLFRYRYLQGRRELVPSGGVETNDLGEYRIFGIAAGRYFLSVSPPYDMGFSSHGPGGQGYIPTYYPGASDPGGATSLEVQPGAQLKGIDVALMKTHTVSLRGHAVLEGSGRAIENANLILTPRQGGLGYATNFESYTNAHGEFLYRHVVPGAYYLQAQWEEDGKSYSARQALDVKESDVTNLVLELSGGAELKGQLRVEGRPLPNLRDIQVILRPETRSLFSGPPGVSVRRDGSFTISNVLAERYTLNCYGNPEDYYIKSARWGDKDVLETGLEITHSASGELEVVLSSKGGQIEGVVLNAAEQPETGAMVVAVPDEPRRAQTRLYKEVTTDQYGRFTIKGIAPGGYRLFAWEDVESGAYQDPEFLETFEARGEPVAIQEGSAESAQLKLIRAEGKKTAPANAAH